MYYTCVAKLFNDAVPFLSVVEQRKVAEHAPDRDKARHVLWQPAVWLRLSRARQVTLAIETPEALLHLAGLATASRRSWEVIACVESTSAGCTRLPLSQAMTRRLGSVDGEERYRHAIDQASRRWRENDATIGTERAVKF